MSANSFTPPDFDALKQLQEIAAVLGYPKETPLIASCDFLVHAVRDLQRNYIAARDAYAGLKGTTDALLADADRRLALQSESAQSLARNICIWTPSDGRPAITLQIPNHGFWTFSAQPDDPDGGSFLLEFKRHFKIQGTEGMQPIFLTAEGE